jgi:hypothetical protein
MWFSKTMRAANRRRLGLNISQDLAYDIGRHFTEAPQHHLLPELLLAYGRQIEPDGT